VTVNPAAAETEAEADGRRPPRKADGDPANAGIRRQPELPEHEYIEPATPAPALEFTFGEDLDQEDEESIRLSELRRQMGDVARRASLDPGDNLGL
jgi:type IV secretion system protein VirD4